MNGLFRRIVTVAACALAFAATGTTVALAEDGEQDDQLMDVSKQVSGI